jgi:hypothetical protein
VRGRRGSFGCVRARTAASVKPRDRTKWRRRHSTSEAEARPSTGSFWGSTRRASGSRMRGPMRRWGWPSAALHLKRRASTRREPAGQARGALKASLPTGVHRPRRGSSPGPRGVRCVSRPGLGPPCTDRRARCPERGTPPSRGGDAPYPIPGGQRQRPSPQVMQSPQREAFHVKRRSGDTVRGRRGRLA